ALRGSMDSPVILHQPSSLRSGKGAPGGKHFTSTSLFSTKSGAGGVQQGTVSLPPLSPLGRGEKSFVQLRERCHVLPAAAGAGVRAAGDDRLAGARAEA